MPGYITYNKNEGSLINYTLYTSNVEDGTQLYYDVVSVASQNSSVTLNPSSLSMNESETISFSGSVIGIADNTNFYYEITGTVNSSDFADGTLTGIATVSNGIYTITKTLLPFDTDSPEESQENFQLILRIDSNTGDIVGTSSTVYVNNVGFTAFTFNSGGTKGQYGPTLEGLKSYYGISTYPWLNNTNYFNATGGIQLWTVPRTGTYRIVAAGAKGDDSSGVIGGLGAIMQGDFSLVANQKIKISVGQTSGNSGGGGTFVVNNTVGAASTSDILVIAGGGGCGNQYAGSQPQFSNASLSDPSKSSASWPSYVSDGTQASGGNGGGSAGGNGGGGGFLTDGTAGSSSPGGKSFLNGLEGGSGGSFTSPGSFGGAGASRYTGGGGGGFSGGGGAGQASAGGTGGGGSSLNNGTNQSNSIGNSGSGYVSITKL